MADPNAGQGGGYSQQTAAQAQAQSDSLRTFWSQQMREVQAVGTDPVEFKNHQLPLARIKKIMKSDEDVRMISAEAPVLFARACEMFILELTLRAWAHAEENKRRTLQRNDVAAAITRTDVFDFLVDIVPKEDRPDAGGGAGPVDPAAAAAAAAQAAGMWNGAYPGAPGAAVVDPAAMQQYWQQQAVAAAAAGMPPPWAGPGGEGGG